MHSYMSITLENKHPFKKIWIIYGLVLVAYICIGIYAGINHEPWADEAQAWLIARDSHSIIDVLRAVKYEGTFPFWHFIVKGFQLAGLDYEHYFVIPLFFSAIGVIILFFTETPVIGKIFIPFSFYVVFQNTVVARTYCLVFPAMMLILLFYKKRFEKPVKYNLSLFFLGLSSSYGVIIVASFMLWDLILMIRKRFKDPLFKKYYIPYFSTGVILVVLSLLSLPPADCSSITRNYRFLSNVVEALLMFLPGTAVQCVFLVIFLGLCIYYFRHHLIQATVMLAPLVLYMALFYQAPWHMTYLYFLIVVLMVILRDDPPKEISRKRELVNLISDALVMFLLVVQCFTGFYSIYIDYKEQYYPAKEVAAFLEPYYESGASIERIGFYTISVSPYFDEPLYSNDVCDKSYYIWSNSVPNDYLSSEAPDVVVVSNHLKSFDNSDYVCYKFEGHMIYKLQDLEYAELYVYVKESELQDTALTP